MDSKQLNKRSAPPKGQKKNPKGRGRSRTQKPKAGPRKGGKPKASASKAKGGRSRPASVKTGGLRPPSLTASPAGSTPTTPVPSRSSSPIPPGPDLAKAKMLIARLAESRKVRFPTNREKKLSLLTRVNLPPHEFVDNVQTQVSHPVDGALRDYLVIQQIFKLAMHASTEPHYIIVSGSSRGAKQAIKAVNTARGNAKCGPISLVWLDTKDERCQTRPDCKDVQQILDSGYVDSLCLAYLIVDGYDYVTPNHVRAIHDTFFNAQVFWFGLDFRLPYAATLEGACVHTDTGGMIMIGCHTSAQVVNYARPDWLFNPQPEEDLHCMISDRAGAHLRVEILFAPMPLGHQRNPPMPVLRVEPRRVSSPPAGLIPSFLTNAVFDIVQAMPTPIFNYWCSQYEKELYCYGDVVDSLLQTLNFDAMGANRLKRIESTVNQEIRSDPIRLSFADLCPRDHQILVYNTIMAVWKAKCDNDRALNAHYRFLNPVVSQANRERQTFGRQELVQPRSWFPMVAMAAGGIAFWWLRPSFSWLRYLPAASFVSAASQVKTSIWDPTKWSDETSYHVAANLVGCLHIYGCAVGAWRSLKQKTLVPFLSAVGLSCVPHIPNPVIGGVVEEVCFRGAGVNGPIYRALYGLHEALSRFGAESRTPRAMFVQQMSSHIFFSILPDTAAVITHGLHNAGLSLIKTELLHSLRGGDLIGFVPDGNPLIETCSYERVNMTHKIREAMPWISMATNWIPVIKASSTVSMFGTATAWFLNRVNPQDVEDNVEVMLTEPNWEEFRTLFYDFPWEDKPVIVDFVNTRSHQIVPFDPLSPRAFIPAEVSAFYDIPDPQMEILYDQLSSEMDLPVARTTTLGTYYIHPCSAPFYRPGAGDFMKMQAIFARQLQPPPMDRASQLRAWKALEESLPLRYAIANESLMSWAHLIVGDKHPHIVLEEVIHQYELHVAQSDRKRRQRYENAKKDTLVYSLDQHSKEVRVKEVFVKTDEVLGKRSDDGRPQLKPRIIVGDDAALLPLLGPPVYECMLRLKQTWSVATPHEIVLPARNGSEHPWTFRLSYACGSTQRELSNWRSEAAEQAPCTISVICHGDDQAGVLVAKDGEIICFEGDFTQYDHSQGPGPLAFEILCMRALGLDDETAALLARGHAGNIVVTYRDGAEPFYIPKGPKNAARVTGAADTSVGNSLVTGLSVVLVFQQAIDRGMFQYSCSSDFDAMPSLYADLGFKIKFEVAPDAGMTFLKGWWLPLEASSANRHGYKDFIWTPLPSRILKAGKTHHSVRSLYRCEHKNPLPPIKKAERFMRDACRQLMSYDAVDPLIRSYCKPWLRDSNPQADSLRSTEMVKEHFRRHDWQVTGDPVRSSVEIDRRSWLQALNFRYGIEDVDVRSLQRAYADFGPNFGFAISTVLDALAARDYG